MVVIQQVEPDSAAALAGIEAGDKLVSINGHEIVDVLDFRFYETEARLKVEIEDAAGIRHTAHITKPRYASMGLAFATYLMDEEHSCRNKCVFCFIDQLPKGMRESLYFKDDDARLSFLFGNYITLTNMTQRDIDRILAMHISPVNISVHTMNPALRCKMMNNRFAGQVLDFLPQLAKGGIQLNCQLVLCPGMNDGEELRFSLQKLAELGENLQSIACVPVGLTRYREGLYPLQPYNAQTAAETLDIIESCGEHFLVERGSRTVYASDEFYLLAGRKLPDADFYEGYPQIENGVGMLTGFAEEFRIAREELEAPVKPRRVTVVCGTGVAEFMRSLLDEVTKTWHTLSVQVLAVPNDFFGGTVNVSGLLTGRDMLRALQNAELGDEVLIPGSSLRRNEPVFLDDMTLDELQAALPVPVTPTQDDGYAFLQQIVGA